MIIILIETSLQYLHLMVEFVMWSKKLDGNEGIKCNEYLCGFLLPFWNQVPGEKCSCNWWYFMVSYVTRWRHCWCDWKKLFLSSCLHVPNPCMQFQTLITSFKRQWCGLRLIIGGCTILSHHTFAKNFAAPFLYPTLQCWESKIRLLLLYQSLGVRGNLKLVLII